ncbi:helix-turn-helix transcriptional regulator, partial [Escherichia coli]|nr:helix-turn-helix transcriptional regulator [Escherichia coli]
MRSSAIGDRLRQERERQGLNQEEFGLRGGVNRNTQGKYEKGERSPDSEYLAAHAEAGVDILFVLVGTRSALPADSLTNIESEIVGHLRAMTPYNLESIRRMSFALAVQDGGLDSTERWRRCRG